MKLRLFEIIYLILEKKCITARELSEHFGISMRTVYRDVEALSMAGIPIYTKQGKNGGIALVDKFVMDKAFVSEEEQLKILSAIQSVQEVEKGGNDSVLSKLCGLFQIENPNWISIDFADWSNQRQELFVTVKSSIINRNVLRFDYYNSYGQLTNREVEPIQLWFKGYTWFLKAYCRKKSAMRIFKLMRMVRVECLKETFKTRKIDLSEEHEIVTGRTSSGNMLTFSMQIDGCMGYKVLDSFEEHEITKNDDGSFTVSGCCPEDEWLYGMILSYGNHATIISPNSLKEKIVNQLKKALANYS
jgi:predicted DNA-binding transcriptional regulator YafY